MSNMVVVISDLHFEEEKSDIIEGVPPAPPVALKRNVPSSLFQGLVEDVVRVAREREVQKIEFVLAGDVFDLHRTQLWFSGGISADTRPFVDNSTVLPGSTLETALLGILDSISSEQDVGESLAIFRNLADAKVRNGDELVDIGIPVALHYLPGNHDRLVNATPALRSKVRSLLNVPGNSELFPHNFLFTDPNVFIRHGHEYDPVNFGSLLKGRRIERNIRSELYNRPTLGDFITVQVASRLPHLFRQRYGSEIARDPVLRTIYLRLLEFDDLRPQTAIVGFVLDVWPPRQLAARYNAANRDEWQEVVWQKVKPVLIDLLDDVADALKQHPQVAPLMPRLARWALCSRLWRVGLPLWLVHFGTWIMKKVDGGAKPAEHASREQALDDGADFVAAGHTHSPQVAHLFAAKGLRKKYFVDTGTWRNAVLGSFRRSQFGRVNATTYVAFYGPVGQQTRSFDYRSGMRQDWPVDDSDH